MIRDGGDMVQAVPELIVQTRSDVEAWMNLVADAIADRIHRVEIGEHRLTVIVADPHTEDGESDG